MNSHSTLSSIALSISSIPCLICVHSRPFRNISSTSSFCVRSQTKKYSRKNAQRPNEKEEQLSTIGFLVNRVLGNYNIRSTKYIYIYYINVTHRMEQRINIRSTAFLSFKIARQSTETNRFAFKRVEITI